MLTVIFSSFNGENTLNMMLDSFLELKEPDDGWQIIAVDNASTDNTKDIILAYEEKLPIEYIYEKKQGKNHALNTGLKSAKGDLIVFTDDDVIPNENWLLQYDSISRQKGHIDMFCGKILPYWTKKLPGWLIDVADYHVLYAVTPSYIKTGEIKASLMQGANMACRSHIFKNGITFDATVGPNSQSNYIMGSETSLTVRLQELGMKAWYEEECSIQHIIRRHQTSENWIFQRAVRFGRFVYKENAKNRDKPVNAFFGMPRYLLRNTIKARLEMIFSLLIFSRKKQFTAKWKIKILEGQVFEYKNGQHL